jgi:hypothetical protein
MSHSCCLSVAIATARKASRDSRWSGTVACLAPFERTSRNLRSRTKKRRVGAKPTAPSSTRHLIPYRWVSPTLLPKLTLRCPPRPLRLHHTLCNIPVDRRIWPIHCPPDQSMFDRVDPTIPHMRVKIGLIADVMIPKPPLPNPRLPLRNLAGTSGHRISDGLGEPRLDQLPPGREIGVALWQSPDRVQMIRQHNPRRNIKWQFSAGVCDSHPQVFNLAAQQIATSSRRCDGKEDRGTSNTGA